MAYYVLWSGAMYPGEETRRLEGGDWGRLEAGSFISGSRLAADPVSPIEIDLVEDSGEMPPLFVVPALVTRKDLAETLVAAGVDNIDFYPTQLRDPATQDVWDDYMVGNVVGIMDVIDWAKSEVDPDSPPGIAMRFETMVIDEEKCRGQKLFRLAQRPSRILVSEEVRAAVVAKGFKYVHFIPPEDFA
jgi:hypothetical protein